jgi:hypothetical protein
VTGGQSGRQQNVVWSKNKHDIEKGKRLGEKKWDPIPDFLRRAGAARLREGLGDKMALTPGEMRRCFYPVEDEKIGFFGGYNVLIHIFMSLKYIYCA